MEDRERPAAAPADDWGPMESSGGGGMEEQLEWDAVEDGEAAAEDWRCSPEPEKHPTDILTVTDSSGVSASADVGVADVVSGGGSGRVYPQLPPPADRLPLEISGRRGLVWSAAGARRLRRLRVSGAPEGSVARAPRQPTQLGLPLALLPEEVHLLHQTGLAELVRYPELVAPRSADQQRVLAQHEAASVSSQQRLMVLARHKQLLERADQIVDGKWRKLERLARAAGREAPETSKQQLRYEMIEQLRAGVRTPPAEQCLVQLYCGHPLALRPETHPSPPPPPETPEDDPLAETRRAVYADLWQRGYWLTDGLKFGGHFLAYEGDPLVYHAAFVVRCVTRRPHARDLAGMQRLARGCGKTLLLSWLDGGQVRHEAISRNPPPLRDRLPERTVGSWDASELGEGQKPERIEGDAYPELGDEQEPERTEGQESERTEGSAERMEWGIADAAADPKCREHDGTWRQNDLPTDASIRV